MNQPVRSDEQAMWARLLDGVWPRDAGAALGIPPGRVRYLCEKWDRKGVYDYGVTYDLGWPTDPDALDRFEAGLERRHGPRPLLGLL